MTKFMATRWTGESVTFETRDEAVRFVLRRGDMSELWEVVEIPA